MKTKITLLCLLAFLSFIPNLQAQCTSGGRYPAQTISPDPAVYWQVINDDCYGGDYAKIWAYTNHVYSFKTSIATDYITVTNESGTVVYVSGYAGITWQPPSNQVMRYYIHSNSNCDDNSILTRRTRYLDTNFSDFNPACAAPTAASVTAITSTSATLSWTPPASIPQSGYDLYVSSSNTTPTQSTNPSYSVTNATTTQFLNGLNGATTYYYWMRSKCSIGIGNWVYRGSFATTGSVAGCNSAANGVFPPYTFTPNCNGNYQTITDQSWAGQYSNVNVVANKQYSFSSSRTSDYITITNESGTVSYANGSQPVIWNSGSTTGVIRYYIHSNANCGSEDVNRSRYIRCADAVNCAPPSNLAVSNITSNSCKITWTAATSLPSSGYDLYIITSNTAPDANAAATVTVTNINPTVSLNVGAGTTYYYWIRSNCGATFGTWISGGSFTTPPALICNGATNGLYPDATFTPSCTGAAEQIVNNAYAGEYSNVNVVANKQYTFTSSIATDFLTITNATGTVVLASGVTPLNWSSGTTSGVVRYHLNTNATCGIQNSSRVKYVKCVDAPAGTCGLPTALAVSNITSNSCRLTWNAPATAPSSYDIYIITTNTAPTANTTASAISNNAGVGTLNGIDAATTYYYWIRSNCNGTKSNWVAGGSFRTNAALNCNGATHGLYPNTTFTPSCTGTAEQIVDNAWAGEYSNVNVLSNKQYTFTSSVTTDYITITNAAGTQVLASGTTPLNWNSNSTSGVIRFHINTNANCGTQDTGRTRSVKCVDTAVAACNAPTQFWSDDITATSAVLNWIPSTSAPNGGYLYVYNTTQTIGGFDGSTYSTSADLTDLLPNTTYYWWVAANCVTSQSQWAYGGSFTTLSGTTSCIAPTQFWSDDITATSAVLNWIPSTSAPNGGYLYVYNTTQTIGGFDGSSSSTSADLGDLLPNTTYYWWVAADCVTSQSQWAYGGSFTTLSGTPSCITPTQFWSDDITATSAVLNWIPSTSAPNGGYLYVYNTTQTIGGFDGSSSSTSADLGDLLPNTTYFWWVAADCVTSQSGWAYGGSFTTLPETTSGCWQSISAGSNHTVGIMPDGSLWAWGANDFGQFGNGTRIGRTTPVRIGTDNDWQSVSAGSSYTMAIKTNGTLWGWGYNGNSRLGDGTTNDRISPAQVNAATNWHSVCAGDVNTLAIKTDGTLWAWGYNGYAQFGDGTMNNRSIPYQIGTATNWQSVDTGNLHTLATKTNGTLWAWGTNTYGQLGDGTTAVRYSPVQIGTEPDWKSIAAGANHSVALKTNGLLYTWGHNQWGQLGDYTNVSKSTPAPIFDQVQNIGAGSDHTVGTTTYGNRFFTGINTFGQLGDGTTTNTNGIQVTNSNNHRMIIAGSQHTFSLNTDGSIAACGANGQGQFGNGTIANSSTMVAIACPTNLGIDDFYKTVNAIKVYPNPIKNVANITSLEEMNTVSVFNLLGQEVMKKSLLSKEGKLDFSSLPSGTYLVKVTADHWTETLKVIKQ